MIIRIMSLHTTVGNICKLRSCRESKTIRDALTCSRAEHFMCYLKMCVVLALKSRTVNLNRPLTDFRFTYCFLLQIIIIIITIVIIIIIIIIIIIMIIIIIITIDIIIIIIIIVFLIKMIQNLIHRFKKINYLQIQEYEILKYIPYVHSSCVRKRIVVK